MGHALEQGPMEERLAKLEATLGLVQNRPPVNSREKTSFLKLQASGSQNDDLILEQVRVEPPRRAGSGVQTFGGGVPALSWPNPQRPGPSKKLQAALVGAGDTAGLRAATGLRVA
jgi:hypothetical protein